MPARTLFLFGLVACFTTAYFMNRAHADTLDDCVIPREEVLDKISHPSFRDRVEDLLNFDGRVRYRAFLGTPYLKDLGYEVLREARI